MESLTAGPRSHLREEQVLAALDLSQGALIDYGVDFLDRSTFEPVPLPESLNVEGGQIDWSERSSSSPVSRSDSQSKVYRTGSVNLYGELPEEGFNLLSLLVQPYIKLTGGAVNYNRLPGYVADPEMGRFVVVEGDADVVSDQDVPSGVPSELTSSLRVDVNSSGTVAIEFDAPLREGGWVPSMWVRCDRDFRLDYGTRQSSPIPHTDGQWDRVSRPTSLPNSIESVRIIIENAEPGDVFYFTGLQAEATVSESQPRDWQPGIGDGVRFNLGLFTATLPPRRDDGIVVNHELDLADYSQRWAREIKEPIIAPFNRNVILFVREDVLVDEFNETRFDFPSTGVVVEEEMVFTPDGSTTYLDVMNTVLEHGGFEPLTVTADGEAWTRKVSERPTEPEWLYEPESTVLLDADVEPVLPELPNVLKVVANRGPSLPEEGNGIVTLYNQSTGPGSIDARNGEEVWHEESVDASNQTELEEIAAAKAQFYFAGGGDRVNISAAINPLHAHLDLIGVVKPRLGFTDSEALWRVTGWTMPFGPIESDSDVTMTLTVERYVDVT